MLAIYVDLPDANDLGFLVGSKNSVLCFNVRVKSTHINIQRQWHHILPRIPWLRRDRNIVLYHPRIPVGVLVQATILNRRRLQHRVQGIPVTRDGETFEPLVVGAAGRRVDGARVEIWRIHGRVIGCEAGYGSVLDCFSKSLVLHRSTLSRMGNGYTLLISIPYGDHRSWWLDGNVHLPAQVEMVDKWPVLVANPEPIIPEDQGLRIQ